MYDYDATGSDEISFKAGDKIKVLNRIPNGVDDGWWKGMVKSTGKVGLFPSIICEPLEESDSDEKTEDSLESPLSSCAPPSMAPPRTPDPSSSAAGKVKIMVLLFFIASLAFFLTKIFTFQLPICHHHLCHQHQYPL